MVISDYLKHIITAYSNFYLPNMEGPYVANLSLVGDEKKLEFSSKRKFLCQFCSFPQIEQF